MQLDAGCFPPYLVESRLSLRDSNVRRRDPALKRRAILEYPFGATRSLRGERWPGRLRDINHRTPGGVRVARMPLTGWPVSSVSRIEPLQSNRSFTTLKTRVLAPARNETPVTSS